MEQLHKINADDRLDLNHEFPPSSWEEWLKAVEETLKGVSFDKVMLTPTYEGITLKSIYRREDIEGLGFTDSQPGNAPFVRGNGSQNAQNQQWLIAQEQDEPFPELLNKSLLEELNRGLECVNLKLSSQTQLGINPCRHDCFHDGVYICSLDDMKSVFNKVDISIVPLFFKAGIAGVQMLAMLSSLAEELKTDKKKLNGAIISDPIAELAVHGSLPLALDDAMANIAIMIKWANQNAPSLRCLSINTDIYARSGAHAVQELGIAMAELVTYLDYLVEHGLSITDVSKHIQFNLSVGSNLFMEIAKFRAVRLMAAEILKQFGEKPENSKVWIHASTSDFNKTCFDRYVNILRSSTEGFSAIIGGCDSLEIGLFSTRPEEKGEFARRIARNQQIILREEAHLDKVTDPAGGCWYIENLTNELAGKAWEYMQSIEAQGGLIDALRKGIIQTDIEKTALDRIGNVDKRKDVVVGINMFAGLETEHERKSYSDKAKFEEFSNHLTKRTASTRPGLNEALNTLKTAPVDMNLIDMAAEAFTCGASLEEVTTSLVRGKSANLISVSPLKPCNTVMNLERLRSGIALWKRQNQKELTVFLANMGPLEQHKARAEFALGFFQIAGFNVVNPNGFSSPDEAIKAAMDVNADAICLCSTDDTYPELVPQISNLLQHDKSKVVFILAGFPTEMVETYKQQGVNEFIHLRANTYTTLLSIANGMGVTL